MSTPRGRMRLAGRAPRRGMGALAIVMVLAMATSVAMLYLNRSVLFEQRAAASQLQSLTAQEAAEAGMEWAIGMLNAPWDIDGTCAFQTTTNISFRKRYVLTKANAATNPTTDVVPATTTHPGCKLNGTNPNCGCPTPDAGGATTVASLGSLAQPGFTIAFDAVAGDAETVQVTSWGCIAQAGACAPGGASTGEGRVRLTALVKLRPMLRAMPAAPLTCGKNCDVGGSYNVANADVSTNGILINAGTTITSANGTSMTTLPGQPTANAVVPNDPSLSALSSADPTCTNSAMFNAYFGSTVAQYQAAPTTKTLSCSSTSDCKTKLDNAYNDGWRSFYFASDLQLSGNATYGSVTDPITIVTDRAIKINGNNEMYGVLFSNDSNWNDLGTGSMKLHGAQVSCAGFQSNGNGTVTYDADALRNARRLTGLMVRVPGSWRDFKVAGDARP